MSWPVVPPNYSFKATVMGRRENPAASRGALTQELAVIE
jgi:hypothetical protein